MVLDDATYSELSPRERIELEPDVYLLSLTTGNESQQLIEPFITEFGADSNWHIFSTGNGTSVPYKFYAVVNGEEGRFMPDGTSFLTFNLFLPATGRSEP